MKYVNPTSIQDLYFSVAIVTLSVHFGDSLIFENDLTKTTTFHFSSTKLLVLSIDYYCIQVTCLTCLQNQCNVIYSTSNNCAGAWVICHSVIK